MTPIYCEIGQKRVIAAALDWPGWCRGGRDEAAAVAALLVYCPRYALAMAAADLPFAAPAATDDFTIVERLPGSSGTDFGAPLAIPEADSRPFDAAELARSTAILNAIWAAFDAAAESAVGVALRKGPRGGGRDLDDIVATCAGPTAATCPGWAASGPRASPIRSKSTPSSGKRCSTPWPPGCAVNCRRKARAAARSGRRASSSATWPGTRLTTPGRSKTGRSGTRGNQ